MRITRRQLRRIIREAFAATAQEEAEKINAQTGIDQYGMTLMTDQEFWEDQGISTGEQLAMSVLKGSYSDLYKSVHGIRPSLHRFETIEDINAALHDLDEYANEVLAREKADEAEWHAYEKERAELEALMPTPLELKYDPLPQYSGMGRRTESLVRRLVREAIELDLEKGDVILTGRFKNKRTVVKKIGKDDLGQPTINGMKALSFRIEKLMPKEKWSKKSLAELEEDK